MLPLQDIDVLREMPGYKAILKAVLKAQIQSLVEQLSSETGEESLILTASLTDGTLCHLGSSRGKNFLHGREEITTQFLYHCLKGDSFVDQPHQTNHSQTFQTGARRPKKKPRRFSPSSVGSVKVINTDHQETRTNDMSTYSSPSATITQPGLDMSTDNDSRNFYDLNGPQKSEITDLKMDDRTEDTAETERSDIGQSEPGTEAPVNDLSGGTDRVSPETDASFTVIKVEPLDETNQSYSEASTSQEMFGAERHVTNTEENQAENSAANDNGKTFEELISQMYQSSTLPTKGRRSRPIKRPRRYSPSPDHSDKNPNSDNLSPYSNPFSTMAQLGLAEISSEDDSLSDVEVCFDDDTKGDTEARGIDKDASSCSVLKQRSPGTQSQQFSTTGRSRKLNPKPLTTKYKAILELEKGVKSKAEIARMFNVPQNTLTGWIKNAQLIKQGYLRFGPNRVNLKDSKYKDLDSELYQWYLCMRDEYNIHVNGMDVYDQAKLLREKYQLKDFHLSTGWIHRFKVRHGIKFRRK